MPVTEDLKSPLHQLVCRCNYVDVIHMVFISSVFLFIAIAGWSIDGNGVMYFTLLGVGMLYLLVIIRDISQETIVTIKDNIVLVTTNNRLTGYSKNIEFEVSEFKNISATGLHAPGTVLRFNDGQIIVLASPYDHGRKLERFINNYKK